MSTPAWKASDVVAPPPAETAPAVGPVPEVVITPPRSRLVLHPGELFRYRELLYFLAWRDVKVRYKQTVLGAAWAVLQPALTMILFSAVFGRLAKLPSDGVPYPLFVYAGILPWTFFSNGVTLASQTLIAQQHLFTKVYFPRLFIPTASVVAGLVDFAISFALLGLVMLWYRAVPAPAALAALPALVVLTVVVTLGFSFTLSALTVQYRDFKYLVPFMIQLMMFVTPVVYPASLMPARWRWVLALNPLAGIIDGFRSALLGKPWDPGLLAVSATTALAIGLVGVVYFRTVERRFADIA